ncbi:MAG: cobalamin-binding protein [Granulosicoccaceae bacterium]
MKAAYPERIVCLTEEPTETLYLLGEQDRIVGISGFTVRPKQARREKPKVSAFTSAKIDKILDLKPDLVVGFSDLQADIAAELIKAGTTVLIFNHRSVQEILNMILTLGSMVGAADRAFTLVAGYQQRIGELQEKAAQASLKPRVYFEEWDDPQITGIRWAGELIEIAGGVDCFADLHWASLGKDRILADPLEVVRRQPDIIIGSWCGKKFRPEKVAARAGWHSVPAVCDGELHEIKSVDILQPGPAALSDGLEQLVAIVEAWRRRGQNT